MRHYSTTIYAALSLVAGLATGTLGGMAYQPKPDKVSLYMPQWSCTVNPQSERLDCVRKDAGTL